MDFLVGCLQDKACSSFGLSRASSGLRYASIGCGELLFDLELLEKLRDAGVPVSQISLVDGDFSQPSVFMRQALREFADWQRATAQVGRESPAEILAFGALEDFREAATLRAQGGRSTAGCHLLLQHRPPGSHEGGGEDASDQDARQLALQTLAPGGLLVRVTEHGASAWLRSRGNSRGTAATLEALEDPSLAACTQLLRDPELQRWARLKAEDRAKELAQRQQAHLQAEEERLLRESAGLEMAQLSQAAIAKQAARHEHALARIGPQTWVPTKHWTCDNCSRNSMSEKHIVRYRCPLGCQIDLCERCYSPAAQAEAEARDGTARDLPQLSNAQLRARERLRAREEGQQGEAQPARVALENRAFDEGSPAGGGLAVGRAGRGPGLRKAAPVATSDAAKQLRQLPPAGRGMLAEPPDPDDGLRRRAELSGAGIWKVVHRPHVAVRAKAKNTARSLCVLYPGEEVAVDEEVGPWLRLCDGPARTMLKEHAEAWVLGDATSMGLGKLLERA